MLDFIKIFLALYKATKGVNIKNADDTIQVYNFVENEKYLYVVVSKEVCKKYGLKPDIQFLQREGDNE